MITFSLFPLPATRQAHSHGTRWCWKCGWGMGLSVQLRRWGSGCWSVFSQCFFGLQIQGEEKAQLVWDKLSMILALCHSVQVSAKCSVHCKNGNLMFSSADRFFFSFWRTFMPLVSATKLSSDIYDILKLLRCLRASLLPPVRMKKQSLNSVATPGLSSTESLWTRR